MKKTMVGMLTLSMMLGWPFMSFAQEEVGAAVAVEAGSPEDAAATAAAGAAEGGVSVAAVAGIAAATVAAIAVAAGSSGDNPAAPAAHGH